MWHRFKHLGTSQSVFRHYLISISAVAAVVVVGHHHFGVQFYSYWCAFGSNFIGAYLSNVRGRITIGHRWRYEIDHIDRHFGTHVFAHPRAGKGIAHGQSYSAG